MSDGSVGSGVGYFKSISSATDTDGIKAVSKVQEVREAIAVAVIVISAIARVVRAPKEGQSPSGLGAEGISSSTHVIKENTTAHSSVGTPGDPENDLSDGGSTAGVGQFTRSGVRCRAGSERILLNLHTVSRVCEQDPHVGHSVLIEISTVVEVLYVADGCQGAITSNVEELLVVCAIVVGIEEKFEGLVASGVKTEDRGALCD